MAKGQVLSINVDINDKAIEERFSSLVDSSTMLEVHDLLAKMCDPYVPFLEGPLSQTVEVYPDYIRYVQPYAQYQYFGTNFNHTKDYHPLASAMWDKAMMASRRDEFVQQVKDILTRRARQIYGRG